MSIGPVERTGRRLALSLAALLALTTIAAAQQPSQAQKNAIRQACPADYQAHCAAVPAGGKASFDCLQRNLPSLSSACQRAVKAAGGSSAPHPAAQAAPASGSPANTPAAATGPGPEPAAMTPRQEIAVLRQSCGSDFRALCQGVPLGGGRAIACLRAHADRLSPRCGGALSAARQNR